MGLSIKNNETEAKIRRLAKARKMSMTAVVTLAIDNELAKEPKPKKDPEKVMAAIREIQARVAKLPAIDPTVNADDWMYDDNGMPH
ncbi:MAG: type II toxin-antitoxin system VapB family antitoxin [Sphingopyxis sp.]|nr:type II toxin-antitoxin system VapB family antitoxin [Sphingopyxis sp.]